MKHNLIKILFSALAFVGFATIIAFSTWQLAAGIGIFIWAGNILMSDK